MLSLTSAVTMLAILTIIPSWLQQYRQRWHLKPQMARAMEAKILGWHYWQCWHYLHGSWCYYIDSTTNSDILTLDSYTSDIIDAGTLDPARDFGSVDPYEQVAQWIATVKYSLCTKVESVFWCTCIILTSSKWRVVFSAANLKAKDWCCQIGRGGLLSLIRFLRGSRSRALNNVHQSGHLHVSVLCFIDTVILDWFELLAHGSGMLTWHIGGHSWMLVILDGICKPILPGGDQLTPFPYPPTPDGWLHFCAEWAHILSRLIHRFTWCVQLQI